MNRSPQFDSRMPHPGLRRAGSLALCVFAASCLPVHGQTSSPAPAAEKPTSTALPAAPSITAAGSGMGFTGPTAGFGFSKQIAISPSAAQPGPFGLSPFAASAAGLRQAAPAPLFPLSTDFRRSLPGSPDAPFGAASAPLPSLNQLMRSSSFTLPLNPSPGSFKFSYQDTFRPGASFTDPGRPATSVLFSTTDLGNGVFLTAGTGFGSHSMAGAPAATLGSGAAGGPKHSGPSLNLKLSF